MTVILDAVESLCNSETNVNVKETVVARWGYASGGMLCWAALGTNRIVGLVPTPGTTPLSVSKYFVEPMATDPVAFASLDQSGAEIEALSALASTGIC